MPARHIVIPVLISLLLAAESAAAWGLDCKFTAERRGTLDLTGIERVEISARAGDLEVRPGSGTDLQAGGRACASSQALLDESQVLVRRNAGVAEVVVQLPEEMKGIGIFYAALDLQVTVPADLPIRIVDSSGDIDLRDVNVTQLTDSSGDIVARGLKGDVEINDSSGDVRLNDTRGMVTITDSSGDIVIDGARDVVVPVDSSGDIDIQRVSGSVRIERDSSGDVSISDVGRDVEVLADSSGEVRVARVQGSVRVP
jgi:hypothetical protein